MHKIPIVRQQPGDFVSGANFPVILHLLVPSDAISERDELESRIMVSMDWERILCVHNFSRWLSKGK